MFSTVYVIDIGCPENACSARFRFHHHVGRRRLRDLNLWSDADIVVLGKEFLDRAGVAHRP